MTVIHRVIIITALY